VLFAQASRTSTMAINIQQCGKRFQLRVKHALLRNPFFFTFDSDTEARS